MIDYTNSRRLFFTFNLAYTFLLVLIWIADFPPPIDRCGLDDLTGIFYEVRKILFPPFFRMVPCLFLDIFHRRSCHLSSNMPSSFKTWPRNLSFTVWDVGGQDKIRPLWRHYYQGAWGGNHWRSLAMFRLKMEVSEQAASFFFLSTFLLRICRFHHVAAAAVFVVLLLLQKLLQHTVLNVPLFNSVFVKSNMFDCNGSASKKHLRHQWTDLCRRQQRSWSQRVPN